MIRLTLGALLLATACREAEPFPGVTETGNPEVTAGVSITARSSDASSISVRGDGEVDVSSLWMSVDTVQLFDRDECGGAGRPSFVDPFVSDATSPIPKVQRGQTDTSVYCGALIHLEPTPDPAEGPDALTQNTLIVMGTTEERRPFVIRSSLRFDIPLSRDEGNFIVDATHDRLDVGIDVSVWMDEISLDDGVPDASGTIEFSDTSNTELLRGFEEGLLDAMDLEITDD